ncbi:glucan biosynthesis protein D [Methylobacterium sp. Leaf466]|uniref:glucan biosynthesis protein n=1 Tax=Methylobacterium sp. Leaf466 TaxID=1736386 RepID=UPI0006F82BF1|nr:glucan biosynthesis protein D [Methylobacterium sp. Leaf466]KQT83363.1 glucan biosynthesis protein D [Methylobacterium sp. Leaf466]
MTLPTRSTPFRSPSLPPDSGSTRRDVLRQGGVAMAALALAPAAAAAQEAASALPAAGTPFSPGLVTDLARALAAKPYQRPAADLPESLSGLSRDQYAAIRTVPGSAIFAGDDLGFTVEPLHRGSVYGDRVTLTLVADGVQRPVPYDPARFAEGGPALPAFKDDPGYSGIRIRSRFGGGDLADFALFQGASFFRLVASGQRFGATARALTLRPADPRGEEFPQFRALWIERPAAPDAIVIHALVESESATAALRIACRPGPASTAEVSGTLFARAALDHLGLASMTTRYLFGPSERRGAEDIRAAVHGSEGLRIRTGANEAIWRPLRNPETLQISSFLDESPKGFGLMQRSRDYATYQDDINGWERRPSLWAEPREPWGAGAVSLLEIPSDSDANENVLAYWRPKEGLAAGAERALAYRLTWGWDAPERLRLAPVTATRSGRGSAEGRRRFAVDFSGDDFTGGAELQTELTASPGTIVTRTLYRYPERRTVRVAFELDPAGAKACELRLLLRRDDRPVTETWLYRWTP